MAKKKTKKAGPNKTEMIRGYFKKNPNIAGADIVADMKKREITVTSNYVSNVKSGMNKKKAAKKTTKKTTKKKAAKSDKLSLGDLVKAKKLADELGGVDKTHELLNAVAKLK